MSTMEMKERFITYPFYLIFLVHFIRFLGFFPLYIRVHSKYLVEEREGFLFGWLVFLVF